MQEIDRPYLMKALESLAGAESELSSARYNNCANRCYYACFQAAIDALDREGIRPRDGIWNHRFVPSQFDGLLINRRKRYGAELRGILEDTYVLRQRADYSERPITFAEARRMIRLTLTFVRTIRDDEGSAR
ncbi:MAG TPA: hypothetical protein VMM78_00070 [Thermomicrobiales bacterium]|nr:hypothetical protein [Thermomicrobiales bacterium]